MFLSGYTTRTGRVGAKHSAGSDSSARLGVATEQVDTAQDTLRVGSRKRVPRSLWAEGKVYWCGHPRNQTPRVAAPASAIYFTLRQQSTVLYITNCPAGDGG